MIDWVAGALELTGSWCIGNKWKIGFMANLLGCIAWIYVAITSQVFGLLLVVIPAIIINIRNFIKWRREGRLAESGIAPDSKSEVVAEKSHGGSNPSPSAKG